MDPMYLREKIHQEHTMPDFWRLLWEQDVHTVMINSNMINDHDYHNILHPLGAVHILRQPKPGVPGPFPPPLARNGQHLAYPPSFLRQLSSAFAQCPFCTTISDEDFFAF